MIAALIVAGAIAISAPVSAQIADDGARPPLAVPSVPTATPSADTENRAATQVVMTQSWVIIIQFTDRNDAYLRGRPQTSVPQPGTTNLGDTIKSISQRFGIEYMGARCDPVTQTCMLRYMRNGEVVNFYVDTRTNKVIGREGF